MTSDELQNTAPTAPLEPANAPGRAEMSVEGRAGADVVSGSNEYISWGARTDVGLVRSHNEDSFLLRTPLFAVSDGMGGHAAGEVASSIAVETIAEKSPGTADDVLLGAAVEAANLAVIKASEDGIGKPGMGCTASVVLIDKNRMAVAHVGDSRVYMLRHGTLVRVTHDHSFVEELVDAGEITADEARVHPSRSIITRALGSDPEMYADHFCLDVATGDRIILCSDGLSSMVGDAQIESVAVSSAAPQQCADNLVAAALTAGGADNVTVVVVDVVDDGLADASRKRLAKRAAAVFGALAAVVALAVVGALAFIRSEWYLGVNDGSVAIYQGVAGDFLGIPLQTLAGTSSVAVSDLPSATQEQLKSGIRVSSEDAANETLNAYRDQIEAEKNKAQALVGETSGQTDGEISATTEPGDETSGAGSEAGVAGGSIGGDAASSEGADAGDASTGDGTDGGE